MQRSQCLHNLIGTIVVHTILDAQPQVAAFMFQTLTVDKESQSIPRFVFLKQAKLLREIWLDLILTQQIELVLHWRLLIHYQRQFTQLKPVVILTTWRNVTSKVELAILLHLLLSQVLQFCCHWTEFIDRS